MFTKRCADKCLRASHTRTIGDVIASSARSGLEISRSSIDARGKSGAHAQRCLYKAARNFSFLPGHKSSHGYRESGKAFVTFPTEGFHSMTAATLQQVDYVTRTQQLKMKKLIQCAVQNVKNRVSSVTELLEKSTVTTATTRNHSASVKAYDCIPGPKGIPYLGSVLEYTALGRFSPKEFDKALRHRHNRYGKIFREKLLKEEFLYISDPKDIRLLVQNEGAAPCRPHLDAIVESRKQEELPVGITAMQGQEWLRNRNAINPAISLPKIIKKYRPAQKKIAEDLVSYVKNMRDPKTGEVKEFEQTLNRWALESIAVVLLDTRLGLLTRDSKKCDPAAEKLRKCMDIFFDYGARLTFGVPTWKIWNTKDWKIFRSAQVDEFKYAGYFVDRKLKELGQKSCPVKPSNAKPSGCPVNHQKRRSKRTDTSFTCLLDHVINNTDLSQKDATTVCLELLAGGIDTTASVAVFTLYHLSVNQQHQEHLRNLLREENAEEQSLDDYNRDKSPFSKYLKACIMESMRLNPLTYANARTTEKELVFSGYTVPAGTTVRYTSHLMNLENEDYFLEPEKFIPERWIARSSPYRCTEQFTFTPFGHGARQCPGRRVAEQELDLLFREILKNYKVGYKYGKMGNKVRLFNRADKPAKFDFTPIS